MRESVVAVGRSLIERLTLALCVASSLLTAPVSAQSPSAQVTDKDLEKAKSMLRMPTDAEIDAVRRSIAPLQGSLQRLSPSPARLDKPSAPDPAGLAVRNSQFADALQGQVLGSRTQGGLYVFVSFTIPRASLMALAEQAERAQATLVVRGLKDRSMRRTLEEVQQIIGERKVSWVIDPTAFDRFDVTSVPTVVLTSPRISASSCSTNECTPSDAFAKVAGEVPLEHALREIERRVQPLASVAVPYIRRLSPTWK